MGRKEKIDYAQHDKYASAKREKFNTLYLGNLPDRTKDQQIHDYYSTKVEPHCVRAVQWSDVDNFVWVVFESNELAHRAAMVQPPKWGTEIVVRYAGQKFMDTPRKRAQWLLCAQRSKRRKLERQKNEEREQRIAEGEEISESEDEFDDYRRGEGDWFPYLTIEKDLKSKIKSEIFNRNPDGVRSWRKANKVEVSDGAPYPITKFGQVRFEGSTLNLLNQKFKKPFPIQSQAWSVLLYGRDCIGIAQTGTGKTLAYSLPGIVHILAQRRVHKTATNRYKGYVPDGPRVLVITPTRELAKQVWQDVKPFTEAEGLHVRYAYGGEKESDADPVSQAEAIIEGCDFLVALPGRLLDFVDNRVLTLQKVSYIVFDEADKLLSFGYGDQLERIWARIRPGRQCAMFSATWDPRVRRLAESMLDNPVRIVIGGLDDGNTANKNVEQRVVFADGFEEKRNKLIKILQYLDLQENSESHRVIIFVNSKTSARSLFSYMAAHGWQGRVTSLHGDISQQEREIGLRLIRKNPWGIMVATDIAARGIHIEDLMCVINLEMPANILTYIHRIGRTGRAGKKGLSYAFVAPGDSAIVPDLINCIEAVQQTPNPKLQNYITMPPTAPDTPIAYDKEVPGSKTKTDSEPHKQGLLAVHVPERNFSTEMVIEKWERPTGGSQKSRGKGRGKGNSGGKGKGKGKGKMLLPHDDTPKRSFTLRKTVAR